MNKLCICKEEVAHYDDFGIIKCQYCMGAISDLERCRKIIDYNMPINENNRDEIIQGQLNKQEEYINKIA